MVIIKTGKKGKHLNSLLKYIYKISKYNLYMNDIYTDTTPIPEILHDEHQNSSKHSHPSLNKQNQPQQTS
jgi:hypothetical protein